MLKPRGFLVFVALFAAGHAAFSPVAIAQEPEIDEKAKQVVESMSAFYSGLETISAQATVEMRMSAQGTKQEMNVTYDLACDRAGRFSLRLKEKQTDMFVTSAGGKLQAYMRMTNRMLVSDAPSDLNEVVALASEIDPTSFSGFGMFFLSSNPAEELMTDLDALAYVGEEDAFGVKQHHLLATQDNVKVHLYIATGDQPIVRKIVPDMTEYLAARGAQVEEMYMGITFSDWQTNVELADDLFSFTPPEGTETVDSLPALFGMAEPEESSLLGKPAPDFTLDALGGESFNLADYVGEKIIVLDFWATWCGPCVQALPAIIEVTGERADKDVKFVAVNQAEDAATIEAFLQSKELTCEVVLDADSSVGNLYGVQGIPQTVIIGKDGMVQAVHVGFMPGAMGTKADLISELDTLIEGGSLVENPA